MGRLWSLLFLMVPVLGVGIFAWALFDLWPMKDHWLPENINEHGRVIDSLFMFILYLTGAIFVVTSIALFWFLWKYDAAQNSAVAIFSHGNHTLEVVWSIIPAATLLFIAIYQMDAWADAKMRRPMEGDQPKQPLAIVTGRQFEWRIQYLGPDRLLNTPDDLYTVNELHIPVGEETVLQIESQDVLHSFFLPNMRTKQDVVPGMQQFVWFKATKSGTYDVVCAELCGWGHYKMRGRMTVEPRDNFDRWLAAEHKEQERSEFTAAAPAE